jgi:hypothetical protein
MKDGSKSGIIPDCLVFASNAPGRLTLHLGDQGIIGFDRGIGFLRNIDLMTSPVLRNEFTQIIDRLGHAGHGINSQSDTLIDAYIKMIDEIIFDIFLKRHGGILLLIPDHEITAAMQDLKLRNSLKQRHLGKIFGNAFFGRLTVRKQYSDKRTPAAFSVIHE